MRKSLLVALLALSPLGSITQSDKPPVQRRDSITVSAGISKEQLALENRLNGIVTEGDQLLSVGKASDAVKQYENALDLVRKQPFLVEHESWVQRKLAHGYLRANRPNDAIPIYSKLLDAKKEDCAASSSAVSGCADAQYELGTAKMSAGDFSAALDLFTEADSNYARAEKADSDHEFAMIQLKNQGQAKLYIAVAFFRTGNTPDAIKTVEAAISQLTRVQSDETLLAGIRDDAARSIQQGHTILSQLKSSQ